MQSRSGAVARLVLIDLLGSVVWFPVWWYTKGLKNVVDWIIAQMAFRVKSYGFAIWLKNFFVPMYGQHDIAGKLVSVFMRFVVLIGRTVALVVEAFVYLLGLGVWVVAPVAFVFLALSSATVGLFLKPL